jgi:hypothetical protein
MPGSKPGERRGGRQKGTPDKAVAERQTLLDQALADAFAALGPDHIEKLTPAQYQDRAWKEAAKAGHHRAAFAMAGQVAAFFDAKKAPVAAPTGDPNASHQGYIVTPDQAESVEAWTRDSQRILSAEKSGDLNPDPKPSS